jgi:hypothetical protein
MLPSKYCFSRKVFSKEYLEISHSFDVYFDEYRDDFECLLIMRASPHGIKTPIRGSTR